MLGEPTPHEADLIGTQVPFEKRVSKAAGGDGFADVWKRDFFAWEYKGRNKRLRTAYGSFARSAMRAVSPDRDPQDPRSRSSSSHA